ncbi:hypothetical protein V8J36_07780 [Frigidibacter sp. MR17.14]|uniref:hypothetical protein n=1 Tax=Frigidibacter sp. MR17.14 TaxID=3126509 RepID=UPI00301306F7
MAPEAAQSDPAPDTAADDVAPAPAAAPDAGGAAGDARPEEGAATEDDWTALPQREAAELKIVRRAAHGGEATAGSALASRLAKRLSHLPSTQPDPVPAAPAPQPAAAAEATAGTAAIPAAPALPAAEPAVMAAAATNGTPPGAPLRATARRAPPPPAGLLARLGHGLRLALRRLLMLVLVVSVISTAQSLSAIAAQPGISPLVDAGQDRILAAMDRAMAREATPARITARLEALLAAPERNWVAIDAVMAVAEERGVFLPAELLQRIDAAQSADEGLLASARGCLACMANPAACQLSAQLLCQAPMVLTPAGDIAAVGAEAWSWASGAEVDRINLALGLVGLGATAAILATGGSSATVKVGAGALRTARGMGLVSARLGAMIARAAEEGVDWARLRGLRLTQLSSRDEIAGLLRPAALAPLRETATALGRIEAATGPRAALALLARVDSADEARRIANAAEALGPRTLGRVEVLGKGRFLRATVRLSELAVKVILSLVALMLSLGGLAASACGHYATRRLRRGLMHL